MNSLLRKQPPVYPVEKLFIPEAKSFTLNNGIPVYLMEAGTEEIMRIDFTFRAGQVKEYLPLLASSTNMMLTEGSKNYSSEELNKLIDFYGAFLNLYAEKDRAGIVVFFLNKHIEKVLELSCETLFRPVFPEAELNSLMKKRLHWYMVNMEKVENLASDQFFESVFGKHHPYGYKVSELDFGRMNPDILKEFHSKYYTVENLAVIISGKIHVKTIELLNKYFGEIPSKRIFIDETGNFPKGEAKKKVHINRPATVQTAIRIGSSTINKRDPDYPGLKILNMILGGYFGSRLMKKIREEKGYAYGINSSVSSLDMTGYKVISTEVSKKNLTKTIDDIYKEITLLQNVPVENEEMDIIRNYMSGEMVRMFDGPFALAESFRSAWDFGLDNTYFYRLAGKIKTIESDEIMELARRYYKVDDLYQVTVGKK